MKLEEVVSEIVQSSRLRSGLRPSKVREVIQLVLQTGIFSESCVLDVAFTFFYRLGMSSFYFRQTSARLMASHFESIIAAKIMAENSQDEEIRIDVRSVQKTSALYIIEDNHGKGLALERYIEKKHNDETYRIECYRSLEPFVRNTYLRVYFVARPSFKRQPQNQQENVTLPFMDAANRILLKVALDDTLDRYERIWKKTKRSFVQSIDFSEKKETHETRLLVGLRKENTTNFFSRFSEVLRSYGLFSQRKYVEPFSDGHVIYAFYLKQIESEELRNNIFEDITLINIVPEDRDFSLMSNLDTQEMLYALAGAQFVHQFITTFNDEFIEVSASLKEKPELLGILDNMKIHLSKDTYTEDRIHDAISEYYIVIKKLYLHFKRLFHPQVTKSSLANLETQILDDISQLVAINIDQEIFKFFLLFNKHIRKTNFYMRDKNILSFRMDPGFLSDISYPVKPYGIFYVFGKEFIGFHVRFEDVARGGVRIVRSRSAEMYNHNINFIFDENYNLALTQQAKNKDIPEGGSKGVILLRSSCQTAGDLAFKKYVNGLLDLLLPSDEVVDYLGSEEIIFLGPDEGTAHLMDWACVKARDRGYKFWRSFSTGKSPQLGGIPHDLYGMTTTGVHEYVVQLLRELSIEEASITKIQTGGPDGDLGSNEIKVSKDRIIGVIDGSGVLYDPAGINRENLMALATARIPVSNFPTECLSSQGFFVSVDDKNIELPNGEVVKNGENFRNTFHLSKYAKADLFVPCGGRPRSINISNWKALFNTNGEPLYKYISEGANLFITQPARLRLEENGIILFKDASANKGGVTSSSLEVFLSMVLTDSEYEDNVCVDVYRSPAFREKYISQIIDRIKENAQKEFALLWDLHRRKNRPMSALSDEVSEKINQLTKAILNSSLRINGRLIRKAVGAYILPALTEVVSIDDIIARLPENYLNAIFASHLACSFVYRFGIDASEVDFYSHLSDLLQ